MMDVRGCDETSGYWEQTRPWGQIPTLDMSDCLFLNL